MAASGVARAPSRKGLSALHSDARQDGAQQKRPGIKPGLEIDAVAKGRGNRGCALLRAELLDYLAAAFLAVLTFLEIVSLVFSNEPLASWPSASVVFSVTPNPSWLVAYIFSAFSLASWTPFGQN